MDANRFDGLTRALGRRPSRRAVLSGVAGLLAGALGPTAGEDAAAQSHLGGGTTVCLGGETRRVPEGSRSSPPWWEVYPSATLGRCLDLAGRRVTVCDGGETRRVGRRAWRRRYPLAALGPCRGQCWSIAECRLDICNYLICRYGPDPGRCQQSAVACSPPACGPAGAACAADGECCGGACNAGGCAPGQVGRPCLADADCRSGACSGYVCACATAADCPPDPSGRGRVACANGRCVA